MTFPLELAGVLLAFVLLGPARQAGLEHVGDAVVALQHGERVRAAQAHVHEVSLSFVLMEFAA